MAQTRETRGWLLVVRSMLMPNLDLHFCSPTSVAAGVVRGRTVSVWACIRKSRKWWGRSLGAVASGAQPRLGPQPSVSVLNSTNRSSRSTVGLAQTPHISERECHTERSTRRRKFRRERPSFTGSLHAPRDSALALWCGNDYSLINGINRLINGINRLINGINRFINAIN